MKFVFAALLLSIFVVSLLAQKADDVLATATGLSFSPAALSENGRKLYLGQHTVVAGERSQLLAEMVSELLFNAEAVSRNVPIDSLTAAEIKKIPAPAEAEFKSVFDANRAAFGTKTVEQVRPQIAKFLRNNAEQKALRDLVVRLKSKYKFIAGKDINALDLRPVESLFSFTGKAVSAQEFDEQYKAALYDVRAEIAAEIIGDLESSIFSALVNKEAQTRNIDPGELIAAEITNKMREFSDDERSLLETALRKQLFTKYNVKILVQEPDPVPHNISVDDDPATGKPAATVTVVMFSDFQCSACSATHPVLKTVLGEYGDKVRLVVRDFPLESVHENAFRAALAANAARAQNKYFEYIDILYRNQESLDDASLKKYAAELGLNIASFELDFSSEKTAAEVRKDMADGKKYGIGGTPTIYVNGVRLNRLSAEAFRVAIQRALSKSVSK
ncbi:MAG: thioredoxin domain-containing protein [Pyrinomonadaceae bacterium]